MKRVYDREQMLKLVDMGKTNAEVAIALGCTTDLVKFVKRKNGRTNPRGVKRSGNRVFAWELERVR